MAGGCGSRMSLTPSKSKANLEISPGITLLSLFIAKLKTKIKKYKINDTPLVILVNNDNISFVQSELDKNKYYNYDKSMVILKAQSDLPALDLEGNVIIAEDGNPVKLPDGNWYALKCDTSEMEFYQK